ncbi:MAG: hypothetical protein JXQ68_05915 [Campylobacterales bacterium]|nr:hypothetical protein [Campylobacterales bacterium]
MRFLLFFALFFAIAYSNSFTEKRYIYALDKTTIYDGSIEIKQDSTSILYTSPINKRLTKMDSSLVIEDFDTNKTETIDLSKRLDLKLYFEMIKSINTKELGLLEENFTVKKNQSKLELLPKNRVKKAISKIDITLLKDDIESMIIYFTNRDIIEIKTH